MTSPGLKYYGPSIGMLEMTDPHPPTGGHCQYRVVSDTGIRYFGRYTAVIIAAVLQLAAHPAATRNLVTNSSFEAGIDYRLAVGRWYIDGVPAFKLDATTKVHGGVSLKVPFSRVARSTGDRAITGITVRSTLGAQLKAGQRYTFSAFVKSDHATKGHLTLTRNAVGVHRNKPSVSRDILLTMQWRRVTVSYTPKVEELIYWEIGADADRPGHLWIDAVQLSPGWLRDYVPATPIEAALTSDRLGHIFDSTETPTVQLRVYNAARAPRYERFVVNVFDIEDRKVLTKTFERLIPGRSRLNEALSLAVKRRGIFRALLSLNGSADAESEIHFSVLPRPRPVPKEHGAFGAYLTIAPEPLRLARRMGFTWIGNLTSNGWLNYWNLVEPKQGQFQWYDYDVRRAAEAGFGLMFNLEPCRTPRWAHKLPRRERQALWKIYVVAMVRHYGSIVKHWTIGDEVHDLRKKSLKRNCWTSAKEYALWHRIGYDAVKSADPDAKVILNAWPDFAAKLFKSLDPSTVDILAANGYHVPEPFLVRMKKVAEDHRIRQLWAPGIGYFVEPYYRSHIARRRLDGLHDSKWRDTNNMLVRAVVTTFALGYTRLFHYTATYVGNTNAYSLFEADSSLKPLGAQFAALAWLVDGFANVRTLRLRGQYNRLHLYRFNRRDGRTVFAFWGQPSRGQSIRLSRVPPDGLQLYDQFTNALPVVGSAGDVLLPFGQEAAFLTTPDTHADAVEQAFQTATYRLNRLPDATSRQVEGRFAVLKGLEDGVFRRRPNISLWYRSRRWGWVELLRQRASTYTGTYRATEDGFEITWRIPADNAAFFLEPGAFPHSLLEGAEYWTPVHQKGVKGAVAWRKSRLTKGTIEPAVRAVPAGVVAEATPDHAFVLRNGFTLVIGTRITARPAGANARDLQFDGWRLMAKGPDDLFLHRHFRQIDGPARVTTRIVVSGD